MLARTKRKIIWSGLAFLIFYFTVIEYGHTRDSFWAIGSGCRMVALVWVGKWLQRLQG